MRNRPQKQVENRTHEHVPRCHVSARVSACQSHSRLVLNLREASRKYVELSPSTLPFLTLRFYKKDLTLPPNLLRISGRYSLRFGILILPLLGHIFSVPSRSFGRLGQSDDLVSLQLEVIVDVMDSSSYKLAAFGATSGLGQEVC